MRFFNLKQTKIIYISYIPDDIYYASAVAAYLRNAGYSVVTTPYQTKKSLEKICAQITKSVDAVVSITSPSAARSERFWSDMANARLNKTPVLPFVVHQFENGAPMKHYISATDDITHGCHRLEAALERSGTYGDNFVGQRQHLVKRMMRSAATAVAVAVFAVISALFS